MSTPSDVTRDTKSILERLHVLMFDTTKTEMQINDDAVIFKDIITGRRSSSTRVENDEITRVLRYFEIYVSWVSYWDTEDCYCKVDEFFTKTDAYINEINTPEKATVKLKEIQYNYNTEGLGYVTFPKCMVHYLLRINPKMNELNISTPVVAYIYDYGDIDLFKTLLEKGYKPTGEDLERIEDNFKKLEIIAQRREKVRGAKERKAKLIASLKEKYSEFKAIVRQIVVPAAPNAPFPTVPGIAGVSGVSDVSGVSGMSGPHIAVPAASVSGADDKGDRKITQEDLKAGEEPENRTMTRSFSRERQSLETDSSSRTAGNADSQIDARSGARSDTESDTRTDSEQSTLPESSTDGDKKKKSDLKAKK